MMADRGHVVFDYQAPNVDPGRVFDPGSPYWVDWNANAAAQIRAVLGPGDFLCVIAGRCQQALAAALPELQCVEYGIGYGGTFADFRVFESHAWRHMVMGAQGGPDPHSVDGRFYDTVIPNYYDPADFPEGDGGGGYHLFMGRLIDRKGFQIAADACERLGIRLVVAGEGQPPTYGEYVGVVDHACRADLMGGAEAVWVPTRYVEPFGGVAVEAQLCGTPVITTDFGAFTETVDHGVTGYRCTTFGEFLDAAKLAPDLDRQTIRARALERWTLDAVAPLYERYFERVADLRFHHWGDPAA
jgi:glycosyltransferase involved in cell wall biosynthesis